MLIRYLSRCNSVGDRLQKHPKNDAHKNNGDPNPPVLSSPGQATISLHQAIAGHLRLCHQAPNTTPHELTITSCPAVEMTAQKSAKVGLASRAPHPQTPSL